MTQVDLSRKELNELLEWHGCESQLIFEKRLASEGTLDDNTPYKELNNELKQRIWKLLKKYDLPPDTKIFE